MASIDKFSNGAVSNELRHNHRLIQNDGNKDIDSTRTHLNYSLTPYLNISKEDYYSRRDEVKQLEQSYYHHRKSELYCYKRNDIKTMAGCVVTLPKEVTAPEDQERFFKTVADFLSSRYGEKNVVSISVHYDEGKIVCKKDSSGNLLLDDSGAPMTEFKVGQPHLHFCFIPACSIDHEKLSKKKHHVKEMDSYFEKISANDVLTKRDFKTLHKDMQNYLIEQGVSGRVLFKSDSDGKSINLSVSQLKDITEKTGIIVTEILEENRNLKLQVQELQEKLKSYERSQALSSPWGSQAWGAQTQKGWNKEWEKEY